MSDVSTTKRKPLTPRQRLALFEAHGGKCSLCGVIIRAGEAWIDEHIRPLALGGTNDMDNRGPAHERCAAEKTHGKDGDLARAAKAKRQKQASLGIKPEGAQKIQSRGFPKFQKPSRISRHRIDKSALPVLPRRNLGGQP